MTEFDNLYPAARKTTYGSGLLEKRIRKILWWLEDLGFRPDGGGAAHSVGVF